MATAKSVSAVSCVLRLRRQNAALFAATPPIKAKNLEELFKKTVAQPPIYYLPLTEEQVGAVAIRRAQLAPLLAGRKAQPGARRSEGERRATGRALATHAGRQSPSPHSAHLFLVVRPSPLAQSLATAKAPPLKAA